MARSMSEVKIEMDMRSKIIMDSVRVALNGTSTELGAAVVLAVTQHMGDMISILMNLTGKEEMIDDWVRDFESGRLTIRDAEQAARIIREGKGLL